MANVATAGAAPARMTREERKVIFASSLGTVFEWYDFYLYGSLALYIGSHFGAGPRDGLMTGMNARLGWPIWVSRMSAELTVLLIGLIALMQNSDECAKQPDEHHWGKPSIEQQQSYREDAREQILAKAGLTNLERATDNVKNFKKLMADRIDAMAMADTAVATIATSAGYQAENVKLALTFAQIQIWIAFSKTTPAATVKAWSDALEAMKKDKTFETIMKREGGKKQDAHVTETPRRSGVSPPGAAK